MKTKIVLLYLICTILLSACGGVTPYPTSLAALPTFGLPSTKPFPTITTTPTLTQTPWDTPTPETLSGYPTPQPAVLPTCNPIDCFTTEDNVQRQDFTFHDFYLGKYVLRNWCNIDPNLTGYPYCAVTISSKGNEQIEIWGWPARFSEETGADLTGNGKPDIVILDWSGGNGGIRNIIYEVGDKLQKILDIGSFRPGTFTDLNGDGTYEYIVPYRLWPSFCDCDARPSVVFEYQPKTGYVPATYKFKNTISFNFNEASNFLDEFTKQNPNIPLRLLEEDEEYQKFEKESLDYPKAINTLYNIVVYYLLAGQPIDAQIALSKYSPPDKATEYLLAIKQDLQDLLPP